MRDATFITKEASSALTQSKRTVTEATMDQVLDQEITKANTELLGVLPYIFGFIAFFLENHKDCVFDEEGATHYQIGTIKEPIPLDFLIEHTIGKFSEQKDTFRSELYECIRGRKYYIPTNISGRYIFDEPIRVVPVIDNQIATPKIFNTLVTRQENGDYKQVEKKQIIGIIIHCSKTLFEGHFNGWKGFIGGFIKQPRLLYAIARHYHTTIQNAEFGQFTPVKIVQTFYYLALHWNGKGNKMTIDVLNLLKHVLPSALEGNTIRYKNIATVSSVMAALDHITHDYPDCFDFGFYNPILDKYDFDYADKQSPKNNIEHLVYALKHHLRSHNNKLEVRIDNRKELKKYELDNTKPKLRKAHKKIKNK